jgi:hypothetical protein
LLSLPSVPTTMVFVLPPQVLGKGVLSSGCNQCCVKTIVVVLWQLQHIKIKIECMLKNRMFLNIPIHSLFSFTNSCSWKKKYFFENSNFFLTNNLISVEAAKVTMVFNFVNPFYLQTLTRPRTSMVLGFWNFNINEHAVLIEELKRNPVSLSGSFIIVLQWK